MIKIKEITENWDKLEPGDHVVVIEISNHETLGFVDDKTDGSDVIWIVEHTSRVRRAYDHREGIKILRA